MLAQYRHVSVREAFVSITLSTAQLNMQEKDKDCTVWTMIQLLALESWNKKSIKDSVIFPSEISRWINNKVLRITPSVFSFAFSKQTYLFSP